MLRTLKPFAATVPKFNRAFAFNFAFDVTFDFAYNIQYSGRNVFLVPPSHKYSFIWLHGLGTTHTVSPATHHRRERLRLVRLLY